MIFCLNDTAATENYTPAKPFPYTTLCRSHHAQDRSGVAVDHLDPGLECADRTVGHGLQRALDMRACADRGQVTIAAGRSEEHTSELQSLMRISYAVFCLKKKNTTTQKHKHQSRPSQDISQSNTKTYK